MQVFFILYVEHLLMFLLLACLYFSVLYIHTKLPTVSHNVFLTFNNYLIFSGLNVDCFYAARD